MTWLLQKIKKGNKDMKTLEPFGSIEQVVVEPIRILIREGGG